MTEFNKFYKDKRIYIPLLVFLIFEIILQTGIYNPYLKKRSYAANVNEIISHIVDKKSEHNPDILIIGTSVAYQGLSLPLLQEKIKDSGYKIQSVAIPGSEQIIQSLAVDKVLEEFTNLKLVIYVGEITMPWVSKTDLSLPTLAMIGEFDKLDALPKISQFEYDSAKTTWDGWKINSGYINNFDDWAYLLSKSISYRRDLRDFIVDPGKRLKYLSRKAANPNENFYEYNNEKAEKMSDYPMSTLDECISKTNPGNVDPIPLASNSDHKRAIFDTCWVALHTTNNQTRNANTDLYFRRLSYIYAPIQKRNIKIINVFAPYSNVIDNQLGGEGRAQVWQEELEKINPPDAKLIDFRTVFNGKNSDDYCYDVIHLNHNGAVLFSEALGDYLNKNIKDLIKR